MRTLPLLAAIAMLLLAPGSTAAATSGLALTGPAEPLRAEGPATATVDIALTLSGVTCTGAAEIPVALRLVETRGLRSAALTWESVVFRIGPTTAATQSWTGRSEVGLRVWADAPSGAAKLLASYALPPSCVATRGSTAGEATYLLRVEGPAPAEPAAIPDVPTLRARDEIAYPQGSGEVGRPLVSLPIPVLGAIAGMCGGGAVVFYKRMRALAH